MLDSASMMSDDAEADQRENQTRNRLSIDKKATEKIHEGDHQPEPSRSALDFRFRFRILPLRTEMHGKEFAKRYLRDRDG